MQKMKRAVVILKELVSDNGRSETKYKKNRKYCRDRYLVVQSKQGFVAGICSRTVLENGTQHLVYIYNCMYTCM